MRTWIFTQGPSKEEAIARGVSEAEKHLRGKGRLITDVRNNHINDEREGDVIVYFLEDMKRALYAIEDEITTKIILNLTGKLEKHYTDLYGSVEFFSPDSVRAVGAESGKCSAAVIDYQGSTAEIREIRFDCEAYFGWIKSSKMPNGFMRGGIR